MVAILGWTLDCAHMLYEDREHQSGREEAGWKEEGRISNEDLGMPLKHAKKG